MSFFSVFSSSFSSSSGHKGQRAQRRAMMASFVVSFLMLGGKLTAAHLTGSTAIFSDAAESVIHLFATGFAGFSLWYAATPPDTNHPYGHGKVAYFASAVEGVLILVAAISILWTAVLDVVNGPSIGRLDVGLALIAGLTVVNGALGRYLIWVGRRTNSIVLVSNGQHVMTDMWTSLGVVVGVGLVWFTGIVWFDPVVAMLVAVNILWTSSRLIRRSVYGLMDAADPDVTNDILHVLNDACDERLISAFHQVRHRRSGDEVWIEYHLMFPGTISLTEAHDRSHAVEERVAALFPDDDVHVTAHLEPQHHDEAHPEGHSEPLDPFRDAMLP